MYPAVEPAQVQAPTFKPGTRIRITNKTDEPEVTGEVIIHDTDRMLVLVKVSFGPEDTERTWWLPEYQIKLLPGVDPVNH